MPAKKATGTCLCGEVGYEITGNLGIFQYCHCSRCRKFTGSAHAANIIVAPDQFRWLKGDQSVGRYEIAKPIISQRVFAKNAAPLCRGWPKAAKLL